jgi:hypothetical protein
VRDVLAGKALAGYGWLNMVLANIALKGLGGTDGFAGGIAVPENPNQVLNIGVTQIAMKLANGLHYLWIMLFCHRLSCFRRRLCYGFTHKAFKFGIYC